MIDHKFADENELVSIEDDVKARIGNLLKISINDEISPLYTLADDPNKIRNLMSHGHQPKMGEGEPEVLMAKKDNPRWQMNQKKAATATTRTVKNFPNLKFSISATHL